MMLKPRMMTMMATATTTTTTMMMMPDVSILAVLQRGIRESWDLCVSLVASRAKYPSLTARPRQRRTLVLESERQTSREGEGRAHDVPLDDQGRLVYFTPTQPRLAARGALAPLDRLALASFLHARVSDALGSSSRPLLPLQLGQVVTIQSLGQVRSGTGAESFHSDKYIWPIGYRAIRQFWSVISNEPDKKCEYTCEILDGGGKPLFRVTPSDAPHISEVASKPRESHTNACR